MKMKGSRILLKEISFKKSSPYLPTVPWESHKIFFKNTNQKYKSGQWRNEKDAEPETRLPTCSFCWFHCL